MRPSRLASPAPLRRLRDCARTHRLCRLLLVALLWQGPLIWLDYHDDPAANVGSAVSHFDVQLTAHLQRFHAGISQAQAAHIGWHFHVTMPDDEGDRESEETRSDSRQQLVAFDRDLNIASDIDFETLLLTISSLCPTDAFASFASCDDLAFSNLLPTGGRLSRGFVGSLSERALPALLSTLRC